MKIKKILQLFLIFILISDVYSVSSSNLSEAMDASKNKNNIKLNVKKENKTETKKQNTKKINKNSYEEKSISIGFKTGEGSLNKDDYRKYKYIDFILGGYTAKQKWTGITCGIATIDLTPYTKLDQAINNLLLLNIGLEYRIYFTPSYTFFGNYILFGGKYTHLIWNYNNAFYTNVYDGNNKKIAEEKISSDSLGGIDIFTGWGFNIIQTKKYQLGGELNLGAIIWYFDTYQGFDNDVFDSVLYAKLNIVINYNL